MRKIEEVMNMAIETKKEFVSGNTTVTIYNDILYVKLFNNTIATLDINKNKWSVTMADYPTVTTKSRLRALTYVIPNFNGVATKKGKTYFYVNNEEIKINNNNDIIEIN